MDQATTALRAEGVIKRFTREGGTPLPVLDGFGIELFENEVFCLLGPSGCGKSTALKVLAGLEDADAGRILLKGRPVSGPGPDRSVVFQDDAVFPWLTVRQNIEYGPRSMKVERRQMNAVVDEFLTLTGLLQFADYFPKQLSGGMRKRVDLARAYATSPTVLFMDESFGSLDVITKEQMQLELLRLKERGRMTVLFVTHDIEEAIFVGNRIGIMQRGGGRIMELIDVPFGADRDRMLRMTPEFQELRRRIYEAIAE